MFKTIKKYFNLISMGRYSDFLMVFIPWDNLLLKKYRLRNLKKKYNTLLNTSIVPSKSENINDHEFSFFSQNGEDGILEYIFNKIGTTNKKFIEIGFGHTENNSLYMICKHGFNGLLLDGGDWNVASFNYNNKHFLKTKNIAVKKWLDIKNINTIISENIQEKEIDCLSIDIDGNDYWLWEAINCVSPRVVIMEYNASFGSKSITVPYNKSFDVTNFPHSPKNSHWYHGASLKALYKLGIEKGYILVATEKKGVNCFFIRKDVADQNGIQPKLAEDIYREHYTRTNGIETGMPLSTEEQFERIKKNHFIEI